MALNRVKRPSGADPPARGFGPALSVLNEPLKPCARWSKSDLMSLAPLSCWYLRVGTPVEFQPIPFAHLEPSAQPSRGRVLFFADQGSLV